MNETSLINSKLKKSIILWKSVCQFFQLGIGWVDLILLGIFTNTKEEGIAFTKLAYW